MDSSSKKLLVIVLAIQPFFVVALFTFYQYGLKQYGDPAEYHKRKMEMMQAIQDSILAQQSFLSPENVGDSTLVGMRMHTRIFEETRLYDEQMKEVKTALDSLKQEKAALENLSEELQRQRMILEDLKRRALDEKIVNLAKIYDGMKPPQSVPLFIEMSDTLAVLIMSNMQKRTASKVLGAMAEKDINKATRITKLLALMGVVTLDR